MIKAITVISTLVLVTCIDYTGNNFDGLITASQNLSTIYAYSASTGCIDLGQMNADIFVNGEKRFRLAENSFAVLTVDPGSYTFSASTDDQMACQGRLFPGDFWPPVPLETEPGRTYFLQYNGKSTQCESTCGRHLVVVGKELAIEEMMGAREVAVTF